VGIDQKTLIDVQIGEVTGLFDRTVQSSRRTPSGRGWFFFLTPHSTGI